MTKSTITREQITSWMNDANYTLEEPLNADDAAAARAILAMGHELLAAMDSEPVIADCDPEVFGKGVSVCLISIPKETAEVICQNITAATGCKVDWHYFGGRVHIKALPPSLQPASERNQVRREHAEWSQATFGNVGPVGPLKHLSKEALEAAAEPGDLSEWADMQFLLWDAQRRAGITDEQITKAMIEKLAVNKQREWPEPKDGEPRLHINEQPVLTGNSPIIGIDLASGPDRTVEVRYVAPPGYVMVPKEMTDEIGEAIAMQANCCGGIALDIYDAMLAAAPQEVKGE